MKAWIKKHLPALLRQLVPNLGTVLAVVVLLFAYNAWAAPDVPPEIAAAPLAGPAAQGSTPGTLSYQGYLENTSGQPVDGNVNMTFRLYNVPTGGAALWTEEHAGVNAVPVSDGLFNVHLGSLTPISSNVWNNATLYLGIQVGSDAEMSPREVVGAVPAAKQAEIALDVPDASITSRKMAPSWYQAINSSKVSTISTIPVPTGVSATFNCDTACTALILHRALVQHTSQDGVVYIQVFLDDVRIFGEVGVSTAAASPDGSHDSSFASVSGFDFVNLASGAHTVEVKFHCSQETPGTCFYYGDNRSQPTGDWEHLNVLVFAQQP